MFLVDYHGWLKEDASLKQMIEEVKDIAEIYGWEYQVFEDTLPPEDYFKPKHTDVIYGISFTPPDCDTVWLSFFCNGEMTRAHRPHQEEEGDDEALVRYICRRSVNTEKEGIEIHKKVINLFRYLKPKYFCQLSLFDISNYWETKDEKLMEATLRVNDSYFEAYCYSQDFPKQPDETEDDYMKRTIEYVFGSKKN